MEFVLHKINSNWNLCYMIKYLWNKYYDGTSILEDSREILFWQRNGLLFVITVLFFIGRLLLFTVCCDGLYMYCFSEWKWSCAGFCYQLFISVLPLKILFSRGMGWKPINLYYPATFVCLFKTVIFIFIGICCDHHRVQWLEVIARFVYIGGIVDIIKK